MKSRLTDCSATDAAARRGCGGLGACCCGLCAIRKARLISGDEVFAEPSGRAKDSLIYHCRTDCFERDGCCVMGELWP